MINFYTSIKTITINLAIMVINDIDGDMQRMGEIIHGLEGKLFWRNWVYKADSLGDIAALSIAQLMFEKHKDKVREVQGAVAGISARYETKDNLGEVSKDLGALRAWQWVLEKESSAVDKDLVDLRGLLEDHGVKEDKQ
ncbi:MAG: hypothetical protein HY001_00745 [Candidatus Portnoybacteria bacterium]|nr:hypothetical protein [Candidatus Portnoybacteria bacterium]